MDSPYYRKKHTKKKISQGPSAKSRGGAVKNEKSQSVRFTTRTLLISKKNL